MRHTDSKQNLFLLLFFFIGLQSQCLLNAFSFKLNFYKFIFDRRKHPHLLNEQIFVLGVTCAATIVVVICCASLGAILSPPGCYLDWIEGYHTLVLPSYFESVLAVYHTITYRYLLATLVETLCKFDEVCI